MLMWHLTPKRYLKLPTDRCSPVWPPTFDPPDPTPMTPLWPTPRTVTSRQVCQLSDHDNHLRLRWPLPQPTLLTPQDRATCWGRFTPHPSSLTNCRLLFRIFISSIFHYCLGVYHLNILTVFVNIATACRNVSCAVCYFWIRYRK